MKTYLPKLTSLFIIFITFISCRNQNDEVKENSILQSAVVKSSSLTSNAFQNSKSQSIWLEDEVFLGSAKVHFEKNINLPKFETKYGTVIWQYGMSMNKMDKSYAVFPVLKNKKVKYLLRVTKKENRIYFSIDKNMENLSFFEIYMNIDRKKISKKSEENNRTVCVQRSYTYATGIDGTSEFIIHEVRYFDCKVVSDAAYISFDYGGGGGNNTGEGGGSEGIYYGEGLGLSNTVVEPPKIPITNIKEFFKCIDLNSAATLSIYSQQTNLTNSNGVGHAFISLKQGNNTITFGYYPKYGLGRSIVGPGIFGDNGNTWYNVGWDAGIISSDELKQIYNLAIMFSENEYDLAFFNCADFALRVLNIIGVNNDNSLYDGPDKVAKLIQPSANLSNSYGPITTCK